MRHIASLLAGLIIAPIAWVLIGAGTVGLDPDGAFQGAEGKPSTVIAIAMLAAGGVLVGMTAVTRWSPTGPLTIAIVFAGCFTLFRFVMPDFMLPGSFANAMIPAESAVVAGRSGTVLAIAALLATALLVPGRWRSQDDDDDVVDTATLSTSDSTSTTDSQDPFATSQTGLLGGGATPSAGSGYEERPTDPFAGAPSAGGYGSPQSAAGYGSQQPTSGYGSQQYATEQRSGYHEEQYAQEQQYDYRYGDTQQPYADTQYVQQQRYGGQQYR